MSFRRLVILFFLAWVAVLGLFKAPGGILTWEFFATLLAGAILSTLVHELGHLIVGRLAGFRTLAFAVWPLRVYRDRPGWRCDWRGVKFLGGFVVSYPSGSVQIRRDMLAVVAAGPAASLLFGIAALVIAAKPHSSWPDWLLSVWNIIALWSLLVVIATFVPLRGRTAGSDGRFIQILLRGGERAERLCALMRLAAASIEGLRPRDWDPELVSKAIDENDHSPGARGMQGLRYNWLSDRGEIDAAEATLDWLLAQKNTPHDATPWQLEMAWFQAARRRNPAEAKKWVEAAGKPALRRQYRCEWWRTQAAIAAAEDRAVDADVAARRALAECGQLIDCGAAQVIREYLEGLLLEQPARAVVS